MGASKKASMSKAYDDALPLDIGFSPGLTRGVREPSLAISASGDPFDITFTWTVCIGERIYDGKSVDAGHPATDLVANRVTSNAKTLKLDVFPDSLAPLHPRDGCLDKRAITITGSKEIVDEKGKTVIKEVHFRSNELCNIVV